MPVREPRLSRSWLVSLGAATDLGGALDDVEVGLERPGFEGLMTSEAAPAVR